MNSSPTHAHHRYVINFRNYPLRRDKEIEPTWQDSSDKTRIRLLQRGIVPYDYPNPVAADWSELLRIVKDKVYPQRVRNNDETARNLWWRFLRPRPSLYSAINGLRRVLAISRVGQHASFTFLPNNIVYADRLIVFPFDSYSAFCTLQSRVHEIWARTFGSTLKDDLTYTPSDCFETFPFPTDWSDLSNLILWECNTTIFELL